MLGSSKTLTLKWIWCTDLVLFFRLVYSTKWSHGQTIKKHNTPPRIHQNSDYRMSLRPLPHAHFSCHLGLSFGQIWSGHGSYSAMTWHQPFHAWRIGPAFLVSFGSVIHESSWNEESNQIKSSQVKSNQIKSQQNVSTKFSIHLRFTLLRTNLHVASYLVFDFYEDCQ